MLSDNLPKDLMEEVMVRLPVKSLLRFKCVAKSCGDYEDFRRLILWNPATKEVKVIPTSQWQPKGPYWADYGFGFDSMTKDYKIVQFPKEEEDLLVQFPKEEEGDLLVQKKGDLLVQMYNLSTDSWKKLDVDVSIYKNPHSPMGPYLYGAYHWFACSHDDIGKFIVMRFDFSKEVFGILQSPPGITSFHEEDNDVLGIVDESLSWAAARRVSIEVCIEIWVMNKYGVESSWTKKFEIRPSPHSFFWSVVEFWGDDEIIVYDDDITNELFSCNFRNQRTERLNYHFPMMMDYVESFFPIGGSENTKI
ncbi:hypothetical protein K1719_016462 [Acacia pycnantha]|nr:hypothetical protein K1719_016462 [Acacia pycnantha]